MVSAQEALTLALITYGLVPRAMRADSKARSHGNCVSAYLNSKGERDDPAGSSLAYLVPSEAAAKFCQWRGCGVFSPRRISET
jgi:hypothetical protein